MAFFLTSFECQRPVYAGHFGHDIRLIDFGPLGIAQAGPVAFAAPTQRQEQRVYGRKLDFKPTGSSGEVNQVPHSEELMFSSDQAMPLRWIRQLC